MNHLGEKYEYLLKLRVKLMYEKNKSLTYKNLLNNLQSPENWIVYSDRLSTCDQYQGVAPAVRLIDGAKRTISELEIKLTADLKKIDESEEKN
jgi:hypothetical protein